MKVATKRFWAREWLIFLSTIVIGGLALGFTATYNGINNIRWNTLGRKMKNARDMKKPAPDVFDCYWDGTKITTLNQFYSRFKKEGYDLGNYDDFCKVFSDSIKRRKIYTFLVETVDSIGEYQEYSKKINTVLLAKNRNDRLQNLIEKTIIKRKRLDDANFEIKQQVKIGLYFFAGCFLLLFPLRYFFYSIRWSIKILRKK